MIKLPDLPPPPYRHPMSGESIYDENAMRAYALFEILGTPRFFGKSALSIIAPSSSNRS